MSFQVNDRVAVKFGVERKRREVYGQGEGIVKRVYNMGAMFPALYEVYFFRSKKSFRLEASELREVKS